MRTDIETRVMDLVRDSCDTDGAGITRDTRLEEDLDMDEIDLTELVLWLEDEFGIGISDEDLQ